MLRAFIDESGQRAWTRSSSDYFILGAFLVPDRRLQEAADWLGNARIALGRQPGHVLHWNKYSSHSHRLHIAKSLGAQRFGRISAVVTAKRHLDRGAAFTEDHAYMYAFRMLLERMSWLAHERGMLLHYTLGHVRGFSKAQLREYEARLRDVPGCQIRWEALSDEPSRIERPDNLELLQIADAATSAIGAAFNADPLGNTENRYLREFAHRFYRGAQDKRELVRYGLKMHPWNDALRAAHPWVAAL